MVEIVNRIDAIFDLIASGIVALVDFIINLPDMIYSLVDVIPEPIHGVFISFVGLIIIIIAIKVVSHFA